MPKKPRVLNQVRITGGKLKKSVMRFTEIQGLRPTSGRVRETLFNWLASSLSGASCLDLFAGSGVLGLEALSRGAISCTWVEQHNEACQALQQNIERLITKNSSIDKASVKTEVIKQDALIWLAQSELMQHYDFIFMDPPYQSDLLERSIQLIQSYHQALYQRTVFYIENDAPITGKLPGNLQPVKTVRYGQVYFGLYSIET